MNYLKATILFIIAFVLVGCTEEKERKPDFSTEIAVVEKATNSDIAKKLSYTDRQVGSYALAFIEPSGFPALPELPVGTSDEEILLAVANYNKELEDMMWAYKYLYRGEWEIVLARIYSDYIDRKNDFLDELENNNPTIYDDFTQAEESNNYESFRTKYMGDSLLTEVEMIENDYRSAIKELNRYYSDQEAHRRGYKLMGDLLIDMWHKEKS